MRTIGINTHGLIDFLVAFFLLSAPGLFSFSTTGIESWVLVAAGTATAAYSLATDYQLGLVKFLSMPVHLFLDTVTGILLAVSPWIFGFAEERWAFHLLSGILIVSISLITKTKPEFHFVRYQRRKLRKILEKKFSVD